MTVYLVRIEGEQGGVFHANNMEELHKIITQITNDPDLCEICEIQQQIRADMNRYLTDKRLKWRPLPPKGSE